jgi:myo-inositol-1(or 4)-monophosphatase
LPYSSVTSSKILPRIASARNHGASALDLAYVAAGRMDAYVDGFAELRKGPRAWDLAAGTLVVREAGGMATQISGQSDTVYNQNILAANEKIHGLLKDILNG